MSVYPFIEAEKAEPEGNVAKACHLLEVSRSAYYEWSSGTPSARQLSDAELAREDRRHLHQEPAHLRGTANHHQAGRGGHPGRDRSGWPASWSCVAWPGGPSAGSRRRRSPIRWLSRAALDLIGRIFGPGVREVDTAWCGDITYVRTWEGWLYLATVIDLESRRVVGFAMADHMRTSLVCDALEMAITQRRPAPGLIFHADRGSQYTSRTFRKLLKEHHITQSLSRPGQCWDNAVAESWFSTLKEELIYRQAWPTRVQARRAIFEFIEVFYNRERLHSSLGNLTPVEYERRRKDQSHTDTQAA